MTVLLIALAGGMAWLTHGGPLFGYALVNAILSFWSNGVMSNFRPGEEHLVPDWAALVSMATTLATVVLAILHFFVI